MAHGRNKTDLRCGYLYYGRACITIDVQCIHHVGREGSRSRARSEQICVKTDMCVSYRSATLLKPQPPQECFDVIMVFEPSVGSAFVIFGLLSCQTSVLTQHERRCALHWRLRLCLRLTTSA